MPENPAYHNQYQMSNGYIPNPSRHVIEEVEDEDAVGESRLCDKCMKPTLRHDVAEATLVCIECGLVASSSIIDQTKENRVFAPTENGANSVMRDRTGEKMRVDKLNSIRTEFTGSSGSKRSKFPQMNPSQRTQVDPKDWYADYFWKMQRALKFKMNVYDIAMSKVEKFLIVKKARDAEAEEEAKQLGKGKKKIKKSLTAQKHAFAANILHLVLDDLNYPMKMSKILKYHDESVVLSPE
jgi:transcription initiation factor TFIIIB Brf1 subunit/transcription initiation factor TFIIB